MFAVDYVELSRIAVAAGYYVVALSGVVALRRATLANYRLAALASILIGALWGTFYTVIAFHAPLDMEQVELATYLSRVNHMPVIAALGVMLYGLKKSEEAVRKVQDEVSSRGVE